MQKIGNLTNTADPQGEFTDGSVAQGIPPTILLASIFNTWQREMISVVEGAGMALDPQNYGQLLEAVKSLNEKNSLQKKNNLSEIATTGTAAQIAAAKLAARTNLGLESVIGQLANGGTFASCASNGYYLVTITDPSSVSDMPRFNGANVLGSGFLFVRKSETSICQTYVTSNGGACSRFKLGSAAFSEWDPKYSAVYKPTATNLGIGDIGTGQTWQTFTTTQRASNVNYTNNTGRPIMISVTSGTASTSRLVVDGVNMSNAIITGSSGGNLFVGSVIVPVNSVYQLTSSTPASSWAELR